MSVNVWGRHIEDPTEEQIRKWLAVLARGAVREEVQAQAIELLEKGWDPEIERVCRLWSQARIAGGREPTHHERKKREPWADSALAIAILYAVGEVTPTLPPFPSGCWRTMLETEPVRPPGSIVDVDAERRWRESELKKIDEGA